MLTQLETQERKKNGLLYLTTTTLPILTLYLLKQTGKPDVVIGVSRRGPGGHPYTNPGGAKPDPYESGGKGHIPFSVGA